ncbi:hypothetical protein [Prescottella agglutinans]|nr:hypothetical protein [Prescottella agglutinans]
MLPTSLGPDGAGSTMVGFDPGSAAAVAAEAVDDAISADASAHTTRAR